MTLISQCACLYHVPRTHHVSQPTRFHHVHDAGPTLVQHWVYCIAYLGQHIGNTSPAIWACLGVHPPDIHITGRAKKMLSITHHTLSPHPHIIICTSFISSIDYNVFIILQCHLKDHYSNDLLYYSKHMAFTQCCL